MDVTFPQDLHDLKIRVDHWRTTRWFIREALPKELRDAITESLSIRSDLSRKRSNIG
jgi:hypothetical protein